MSRLHLDKAILVWSLLLSPLMFASGPASVTGKICDSAGKPQMGAVVQLVRPDLSIAASVFTDEQGRYSITEVTPGKYSIKATGREFLPTMRENLRVRSATVVNLTLNSLYEVMQWLPARSNGGDAAVDDWKWTLRSAENRPLLRWLEDGPLVVVSDGKGRNPHLKARLMASGQNGTFGEDGQFIRAEIEETPSDSRTLLARVDFEPGTNNELESMLGFRQDLGLAGDVESLAAVALHSEITGPGSENPGVEEAMMQTTENLHLGDLIEATVGSKQVYARLADGSHSIFTALPNASVLYRRGDSAFAYRIATDLPAASGNSSGNELPTLTARNGQLVLQHGIHQELGWERRTDHSGMQVVVFADSVSNPNLEASSHFNSNSPTASAVLYDPVSGMLHVAGANYSTTGLYASLSHSLPGHNLVRLSYATGDALVMTQSQTVSTLPETHARRAQMYSLSLSGTVEGTNTRWRATYRWQPESTLTEVAPYAADAASPYMCVGLHQTLRSSRPGSLGIEALLDVNNLLAQGYRPWIAPDGSLLVFAENERSVRAGLAFTF